MTFCVRRHFHWMCAARLLVFAGDSQGPFWDRGKLKGEQIRAHVVLAIRPQIDVINYDYLRWQPTEDPQDPLNPAWYLGLSPHDESAEAPLAILPSSSPYDAGRNVKVDVSVGKLV